LHGLSTLQGTTLLDHTLESDQPREAAECAAALWKLQETEKCWSELNSGEVAPTPPMEKRLCDETPMKNKLILQNRDFK